MQENQEILLYNADTLEYAGKILVENGKWEYQEVSDQDLIEMTSKMALRGALSCLISFNLVYEIVGVYV